MIIESKPEKLAEMPETKLSPMDAPDSNVEDYPFYIVPSPPIPGQTGWSIVPW
jgi:hypothetical protein